MASQAIPAWNNITNIQRGALHGPGSLVVFVDEDGGVRKLPFHYGLAYVALYSHIYQATEHDVPATEMQALCRLARMFLYALTADQPAMTREWAHPALATWFAMAGNGLQFTPSSVLDFSERRGQRGYPCDAHAALCQVSVPGFDATRILGAPVFKHDLGEQWRVLNSELPLHGALTLNIPRRCPDRRLLEWDYDAHLSRIALCQIGFEHLIVRDLTAKVAIIRWGRSGRYIAYVKPQRQRERTKKGGERSPPPPATTTGPLDGRILNMGRFSVDGGTLKVFCRPNVCFPSWFVDQYTRMLRRYAAEDVVVLVLGGLNVSQIKTETFVTVLPIGDTRFVTILGQRDPGDPCYDISAWNDTGLEASEFLKLVKKVRSMLTLYAESDM
jgi:hypothetical protein